MCGHYSITTPGEAMRRLFRFTGPLPDLPPRYNVAPTQQVPIVRRGRSDGERELISQRTKAALAATKAAVRSLARSLGAELVPRGIRVNAVSLGPISTLFHSKLGLSERELKESPQPV